MKGNSVNLTTYLKAEAIDRQGAGVLGFLNPNPERTAFARIRTESRCGDFLFFRHPDTFHPPFIATSFMVCGFSRRGERRLTPGETGCGLKHIDAT